MKNSLWSMLFIFNFFTMSAQCTSTETYTTVGDPQCSDQLTPTFSSGIIKIIFGYISIDKKFTLSTVGESDGDTYLSLYDSSDNLLDFNDDASDCGGCKQSTISFTNSLVHYLYNSYIIVSKPGCTPLDFNVKIKYSVSGDSEVRPILSPITLSGICPGTTIQFTDGNTDTAATSTWESGDTSIVDINTTTGVAVFKKGGIATIKLKGGTTNSCEVVNSYLVKTGAVTSPITAN